MEIIYSKLSAVYPKITKNRTYLIENYTLLAMKNFDIDIFELPTRVSISLSKGAIYESLTKEKLESLFKGKYKLSFVPYNKTKDLLITDLPNVVYSKDKYRVSVNTPLMPRDYASIEKSFQLLTSRQE